MGRVGGEVGKVGNSPRARGVESELPPHTVALGRAHHRRALAGEKGRGVESEIDCRGLGATN
jgi:hypothetical protein